MVTATVLRWLFGSTLAVAATFAASPTARADDPAPRVFKPDSLTVHAPLAKLGRPVTVPVVFRPPSGWQIVASFPMNCKLFPPAGVTAEKVIFLNSDATLDATQGRIDMILTPHETGKKIIHAGLAFGVSDGTQQDIKIVKVSIEMDVE